MMRTFLIFLPLFAVVLLPWPLALLVGIIAAGASPLAPLAAGIFADTLYQAPHASLFPWATIIGAFVALAAVLVRSFLEARIMHA